MKLLGYYIRILYWLLFPLMQKFSSVLLLRLAFQSLGVVFGDLGTSPLYVFYNAFPHGVNDDEDVIGALSLIIYTLTLIPLLKYVFVVLRANDNGQGEIIYPHKVQVSYWLDLQWNAVSYDLLCTWQKGKYWLQYISNACFYTLANTKHSRIQ